MEKIKNEIASHFNKCGYTLSEIELKAFVEFYRMLIEYNDEYDLTRLKRSEDIIIKHFIDSIFFTRFIDLPSPLLDIGTGAGFPGVPLKIMNPELSLILAEPRKRRVLFLEKVRDTLGLSGVEIYPHLVTDKSFFAVEGVITRALESIEETLTRVSHFLPIGGRIVLMKGPRAEKEKTELLDSLTKTYSLEHDTEYTLPGTGYERRLLVYRKETGSARKTYRIMKDPKETVGHPISSADNRTFKRLKKLTSIEGIKKSGQILVSGRRMIIDLLERDVFTAQEYIISDGHVENNEGLMEKIEEASTEGKLIILKKGLFKELDIFDTGGPLLTVAVPPLKEWPGTAPAGCVLMLPFQDPANIGAAIRSAAAFGVESIILLKEAAHPFLPKAVRASAGAVFSARLYSGPTLIEAARIIRESEHSAIALDRSGPPLDREAFPESFFLIPGIEGPGLPDILKSCSRSIPISGEIESLNAAAALSVALYEWTRQKRNQSPANSQR